MERVLIN